ncbi:hypothetical protein BKA56DRAFT_677461 [Ilyonectria sp. MPI-CAGE-AT-0026]|nr:hypothetical protein BKA56DRAFT_677461 [Ilyonectria sp. MPI-CAGE-AT-0026]
MDSTDIRHDYDPAKDVAAVSGMLMARMPPPLPDVPSSTGLDCLLVVLRRIYDFIFIGEGWNRVKVHLLEAEKNNHILRYLWQTFEPPVGRAELEKAVTDKMVVINALPQDQSFQSLCIIDRIMKHDLWSISYFNLFAPIYRRTDENPEWHFHRLETSKMITQSILQLDCVESPEKTLQALIDGTFGLIHHSPGNDSILTAQPPGVVRIAYTSADRSHTTLPFDQLRTFDMPVGQFHNENEELDYFPNADIMPYSLLAVVRLRRTTTEDDLVRLYDCDGENLLFSPGESSYLSDEWSLGDPESRRYVLFFGANNAVKLQPMYTEVRRPRALDEKWEKEIADVLAKSLLNDQSEDDDDLLTFSLGPPTSRRVKRASLTLHARVLVPAMPMQDHQRSGRATGTVNNPEATKEAAVEATVEVAVVEAAIEEFEAVKVVEVEATVEVVVGVEAVFLEMFGALMRVAEGVCHTCQTGIIPGLRIVMTRAGPQEGVGHDLRLASTAVGLGLPLTTDAGPDLLVRDDGHDLRLAITEVGPDLLVRDDGHDLPARIGDDRLDCWRLWIGMHGM